MYLHFPLPHNLILHVALAMALSRSLPQQVPGKPSSRLGAQVPETEHLVALTHLFRPDDNHNVVWPGHACARPQPRLQVRWGMGHRPGLALSLAGEAAEGMAGSLP